ncbi:hypothetical protein [Paenibacillus chungangensis]|uniref:Uncharacterized protein n=1 Tax=Paenibacillus chungangensis TaxID=696535 RepID=A0ABW3HLD4_9BACL
MKKIVKLIRKHSFLDVRVVQREARSLSAMGYPVTVLAPLYSGMLLDINRKPTSKAAYSGHLFQDEGVTFIPYHAKKIAKQVWEKNNRKMLLTLDSVEEPPPIHWDGLLTASLAADGDVYHAHEPATLYEAVVAKQLLRQQGKQVKVIYDAHELEEDTPLLKKLMSVTDHLITVSESIREIYKMRYPEVPVSVIYNSPFYADQQTTGDSTSLDKPFTIGYEGNLSLEKGDPFRIMSIIEKLVAAGLNVRFKILGQVALPYGMGKINVEKQLRNHSLIDWGWADYEQLNNHWRQVDAGYIFYDLKSANRIHALPNKLFSLMNNGIPIVVNAAKAMGTLIHRHQCGIVIPKESPSASDYAEQFVRLIHDRKLLHTLGENAREAIRTTYSWNVMEQRLKAVYESL